MHNNKEVLEYWNRDEVESMYDKHLINLEIQLLRRRLRDASKILDAGCGEGEGTFVYAQVPGAQVCAVDFSDTRLAKAKERLRCSNNVSLRKVDFLGEYALDLDFDFIVSQRFLINLMEWELQKKVLKDLMGLLGPKGRLLMLEGSRNGVDALNAWRSLWDLPPIPVKWHNLFFEDERLLTYMSENQYRLVEEDGLGAYHLLTRGIRPTLDKELNWDCRFNEIAATLPVSEMLALGSRFSRLKLWVFERAA